MKHWTWSEWCIAIGLGLALMIVALYFAGVSVRLEFPPPAAPSTSGAAS